MKKVGPKTIAYYEAAAIENGMSAEDVMAAVLGAVAYLNWLP